MRQEDVMHFYNLISEVEKKFPKRKLGDLLNSSLKMPLQGVYFFFENGELRDCSKEQRVVRIGTHAAQAKSKASIKQKLSHHKGPESLYGNHRASVFRELIGYSVINKQNLTIKSWGIRKEKSNLAVIQSEKFLEKQVSEYIRNMNFMILEVPGDSSKDNDRAIIERNSIALLSNYNRIPINAPSVDWMGNLCLKPKIIESGLWNSNYVELCSIEPNFFELMEKYMNRMIKY